MYTHTYIYIWYIILQPAQTIRILSSVSFPISHIAVGRHNGGTRGRPCRGAQDLRAPQRGKTCRKQWGRYTGRPRTDHNRETTRKWETASECFETLLNRKGLASFIELACNINTTENERTCMSINVNYLWNQLKPYEVKWNHCSAKFSTKPKTSHKI